MFRMGQILKIGHFNRDHEHIFILSTYLFRVCQLTSFFNMWHHLEAFIHSPCNADSPSQILIDIWQQRTQKRTG